VLVERPTVRDYMNYQLLTIIMGAGITGYFITKNIKNSEWSYLVANTVIATGLFFGARALEVSDNLHYYSMLRS